MKADEIKAIQKQITDLNKESAQLMKDAKKLIKDGKGDEGMEKLEESRKLNNKSINLGFEVLENS